MALADRALKGLTTPEEVFEQSIPLGQNELPLWWMEATQEQCIVKSVTAHGVSGDPLTKAYELTFQTILNDAGYWKTTAIHPMRHALGATVDGMFGEVTVVWEIVIV